MQIVATQKNTRQTPRKVRLVANSVKKLPLGKALRQLSVIERRPSIVIMKVLRQALANAWHNHGLKIEDLKLSNILVEVGPTYKRFQAASRGRAHGIFKRSCHVKVILESGDKKVVKPMAQISKQATKSLTQTAKKIITRKVAKKADKKRDKKQVAAPKDQVPKTANLVKTQPAGAMKDIKVKGKSTLTRTKSFGGRG